MHDEARVHDPVLMNISGLSCTDWTPLGGRQGSGGETQKYHNVWLQERLFCCEHSLEDVFITENSEAYPAWEQQARRLEHAYHFVTVKCSPTDLGHPVRRSRTYTAGLRKSGWVWCGPTSPQEVQQQFMLLFASMPQVSGNIYFQAGLDEVRAWIEHRASERHFSLPPKWPDMPMGQLLAGLMSPSALFRKKAYEKLWRGNGQGEYLADIDHNPGFGPTPGRYMPALDTHPSVFSFQKQRLALPLELLSAQGLDAYPALSHHRCRSPVIESMCRLGLKDREIKSLLGNAMHVPTMACWLIFILMNAARRPTEHPERPLRQTTADFEDES